MKKILSVLALSVGAIGAAQAQNQSLPIYVGGSVGMTSLTSADVSEDNGAAVNVYGGYQLTDTVAAEIGYTKGPKLGDAGATAKADVFTVQAVASVPVADKVSVFGKAGLAHAEIGAEKGWSPVVGVGAEYSLSPNLSAVGEVSYIHDIAKTDAGAVTTSVGLKYRF